MPRPENEIVPFYKVTGILSNEDTEELRNKSSITLEQLKCDSVNKRIVRINSYTWVEVCNDISDEEARNRYFRKRKALKEIY